MKKIIFLIITLILIPKPLIAATAIDSLYDQYQKKNQDIKEKSNDLEFYSQEIEKINIQIRENKNLINTLTNKIKSNQEKKRNARTSCNSTYVCTI